jgi:hypothetical protein
MNALLDRWLVCKSILLLRLLYTSVRILPHMLGMIARSKSV